MIRRETEKGVLMVRGPGFEPGLSAWKADVLVQARLAPPVIFILVFGF